MRHNLPTKIGKGRSIPLSPEILVNMYAERAPDGAKSQVVCHGSPGFTLFSTIVSGKAKIRGLYTTLSGGALYCVVDRALYSVNSAGTASSLGTISGSGRVFWAESPSEIVIVAGSQSYTYNTTEGLELITHAEFPGATSVTYQDGYFIFTNRQTASKDQFFISSLLDGEIYDALDFATAENYPDNLLRVLADHSELLLFGTDSIEIWFNSGASDFPFAPAQGSIIDQGLGAVHSVQKVDESVLWLDNEGIVRRLEGNTPVRISDHAIEYLISKGDWENATSYAYTMEGHQFYVLTIPKSTTAPDAITVVYDAATQLWHQRKSYELDYSRVGFYTKAFGKHIVGDVLTGLLYEYSLDTYQENGDHLIAEMHFPQIQNDGNRFIVHRFQLDMETGNKQPTVEECVNLVEGAGYVLQGSLTGVTVTAMDEIGENRIAAVSGSNLIAYDFQCLEFAQNGSGLALGTLTSPAVARLGDNLIAFYNSQAGARALTAYQFTDGVGWAQVGNALDLGLTSQVINLAYMMDGRIAVFNVTDGTLGTYEWDDSDFSLTGSVLTGIAGALKLMRTPFTTNVHLYNDNAVTDYAFTGSGWFISGGQAESFSSAVMALIIGADNQFFSLIQSDLDMAIYEIGNGIIDNGYTFTGSQADLIARFGIDGHLVVSDLATPALYKYVYFP